MFDFLKRKTKKEEDKEELEISEFDILTNSYNTIIDEIVDIQKDIVKQNEAIEEQNKLLESIMKKVDNNDIELKKEEIIKALEGLEPTKLKPVEINNFDEKDFILPYRKGNKRGNGRNKTGVNRVSYVETGTKNWKYQYCDENKIRKNITNSSLKELEKIVKSKGLDWYILDEELYEQCKQLNHVPQKDKESVVKKSKGKKTSKKRKNGRKQYIAMRKNPNDRYQFPPSYREEVNFKLGKDGLIRSKKKTYESYELTYLFSNVDFPVLNKDYDKVCHIIDNLSFAKPMGMAVVYTLQKQLSGSGGKLLDLIFEIFKNDFEVPFFIDFGYDKDNDQLLINGGAVGINKKQLKIWVDELNDSFAPEFTILKIMQRT